MRHLSLLLVTILVQACSTNTMEGFDENVFYGPGDRPSVCLARSKKDIAFSLEPMSKIAEALLLETKIDEVGVVSHHDGSDALSISHDGLVVENESVITTDYWSLFVKLPHNFFAPRYFMKSEEFVIAVPGDYFPGIFMLNSGPQCGGTDKEWFAESKEEFTIGVSRAMPISYRYDPNGLQLDNPCSDEAFLFEDHGMCELRLNDHWAVLYEYINTL